MPEHSRGFVRVAIWLLPLWVALLFYGTLTHQPDPLTAFADWSAYVTTSQFLASHLVASIAGAVLGSLGIIALALYLQDSPAAGRALTGMAMTVAANILNTSIFGVAAFVQPAIGRAFLAGQTTMADFYNEVYAAPLFITAAIAALLLIAGGILTGIAIAASGRYPRWAGWVYAITLAGFVLALLMLPVAQTPLSVLLFIATVVVAWRTRP